MGIRLSYVRNDGETSYPLAGLGIALLSAVIAYGGIGLWLFG